MHFEWDDRKNRRNLLKHNVRFETAALVFEDPCALTRPDPFSEDEERWLTLEVIDAGVVLLVVHTWLDHDEQEVIRIISARNATPRERRSYEEAHQRTKARHRRPSGYEGRGH
jgi:uncharacterized DUF497 family protein